MKKVEVAKIRIDDVILTISQQECPTSATAKKCKYQYDGKISYENQLWHCVPCWKKHLKYKEV